MSQLEILKSIGKIKRKWFDVSLVLFLVEGKPLLVMDKIVVDEPSRNKGMGTAIMYEITSIADSFSLDIALTPNSGYGGDYERLKVFYKRFDFKETTGYPGTMVRLKKENR
jgi:GNAT superfamily N-acetyltransferase